MRVCIVLLYRAVVETGMREGGGGGKVGRCVMYIVV